MRETTTLDDVRERVEAHRGCCCGLLSFTITERALARLDGAPVTPAMLTDELFLRTLSDPDDLAVAAPALLVYSLIWGAGAGTGETTEADRE
jgi:hypothetical protein